MLKNFTLLLLFSVGLTGLTAQTIIWPVATDSATIRASQFSDTTQIFWQRGTITPPANFTGWVTVGTSSGTAAKKDSAVWSWSRNGRSRTQVRGPIASPTAANGSAIFDSDFLKTSGQAPVEHSGELISPTINAAGFNDIAVIFHHHYYQFDSEVGIAWSENNGATWVDTIPFSFNTQYNQSINGVTVGGNSAAMNTFVETIPGDIYKVKLRGSKGTNQFKIKFIFSGDGFFFILDDVRLAVFDNDLQVNRDWFAYAPNMLTPREQVEPFYFLTDISNQGNKAQPNTKVNISITRRSTGAVVHNATRDYGLIKADSLAENELIPGSFTPARGGSDIYTGIYRVFSDSAGQYRFNDSARIVFGVNDSIFQKETGGISSTRPSDAFWGASTNHSYRIGNYFYVPRGKGAIASKITARVGNASQLGGVVLQALLYEWKQPRNDSGIVRARDLTLVGAGEFQVPTGAPNFSFYDFPLQPIQSSGRTVVLKDSQAYLAVLEFVSSAPASAPNGNMTMTFETRYDYGAMVLATEKAGRKRFAGVLGGGALGEDFTLRFFGGSGYQFIPVVRLTVLPLTVGNKDILSNDNSLEIYPNPVNESTVNFDIALAKKSDMTLKVVAIDGRVMMNQMYSSFEKNTVNVNVQSYPAGTYIAQLLTADGILSKRFVVAK